VNWALTFRVPYELGNMLTRGTTISFCETALFDLVDWGIIVTSLTLKVLRYRNFADSLYRVQAFHSAPVLHNDNTKGWG
jgi:hypothetical protein